MTDVLLASLHHFAVFTLFAILLAEHVLLRLPPRSETLRSLGRLDLIYGICAVAVILIGIARVAYGPKGTHFYLDNPIFWAKMGVFALIGLISIVPTLRYLRWSKALRTDGSLPDPTAWSQTRGWVQLQLALFLTLPVLAVLMARGYGLVSH